MTKVRKRAAIAPLVAGLAVVVLSVAIGSAVALGRNGAHAATALPAGVASSPAASDATRDPVPAECPPTFDPTPASTVTAPRADFVPRGATGATLCRYFQYNDAGVIPLIEASDLPGEPGALVQFLNSLPKYPTKTESARPDGTVLRLCLDVLVPRFHVVVHYSDSVNVLVRTDPGCEAVTSDGDGRVLQHVSDLLRLWGA